MRIDNQQIELSRNILERSQQEAFPYEVSVMGRSFLVYGDVFSPKYFEGPEIFTTAISYRKGERFLEMGCGCGVTSITAALQGAGFVQALDINSTAVENTRLNTVRHKVEHIVQTRVSDLFLAVEPGSQYDTIYWNLPFIPIDPDYKFNSMLERSLFDPGYKITRDFLSQAPSFLAKQGRILVGFGDFGDIEAITEICDERGLQIRQLLDSSAYEGGPVKFILLELRQDPERP